MRANLCLIARVVTVPSLMGLIDGRGPKGFYDCYLGKDGLEMVILQEKNGSCCSAAARESALEF